MGKSKVDYSKYEVDAEATKMLSAKKSGGVDYSKYEVDQDAMNLNKEMGFLEKVDSYTGAPARRAVGELQAGRGLGSAISKGFSQFGENPSLAPTAKEIVTKAGISDEKRIMPRMSFSMAKGLPPDEPIGDAFVEAPSYADFASVPVDMALDVTNLPMVAPAKLIAKGALKGAEAGLKGISKLAKPVEKIESAMGRAGKVMIQSKLGVPREVIDNYLQNFPELKDKVDAKAMIEELSGKLDQSISPYRQKLKDAENAVIRASETKAENTRDLMLKMKDAKTSLKEAEQEALGAAASRVSARVKDLNKSVTKGSEESFEILDKEGVMVPVTPIKSDLSKAINLMEPNAITDEQIAVVDLLKRYRERLDKFGKEVSGGQAKRTIQSLDREMSTIAPGEIARLSKEDQILGSLRRRFDAPLKASDAYADKMKTVSEETKLLMSAKDLSQEGSAVRALQSAQKASGVDQLKIIQALENKYGEKFLDSVAKTKLPEYARLRGLVQRYNYVKKGQDVKQAEGALNGLNDQFGVVADMSSKGLPEIQQRIKSNIRALDPNAIQADVLNRAGNIAGLDMSKELKDIKTIASFEKGFNRGSSNVNFWGAMAGGLVGLMGGPLTSAAGIALGATSGKLVDAFGPAIARKILDQVPNLQKMKPSKWIAELDVPKSVKMKLEDDLALYQAQTKFRQANALSKPLRMNDNKEKK